MLRLNDQLKSVPQTDYAPGLTRPTVMLLDGALTGDGNGNIDVEGKPGWIHIRIHNSTAIAWNMANVPTGSDSEGLAILVQRMWLSGTQGYVVLGRLPLANGDDVWGKEATGEHAKQHEINDIENLYGYDAVSVYQRMLVPCRAVEQSEPDMTLWVEQGFYSLHGIQWWGGGTSPTFTAPTTNSRYDLLYINNSGELAILQGTEADPPDYPTAPSDCVPVAYVYLEPTTTALVEENIQRDARVLVGSANEMPEAHPLLSAYHSDTATATVAQGDLIVGDSTPEWSVLPVGAAGTVLIGGTTPSYSATPAVTTLTTTGLLATSEGDRSPAKSFATDGSIVTLTGGSASAWSETPSGTIDGTNATFTLAHTPASGTLRLYQNGLRLREGASDDYTLSGATITMNTAPQTGDWLLADYAY